MKVYIYILKCPEGNIRYVGKTVNPKRRLHSHIYEAKKYKNKRYVTAWINSLLNKKEKPNLEIIEECTKHNWAEREKYWISYYRKRIDNLCNLCDGGSGGLTKNNLTKDQLTKKANIMSNTMSKFTKDEKEYIWELMKCKSLKEIQKLYPMFTQQMYSGINLGRQWNHITGLPKGLKSKVKTRKGYTCNRGLYIIRKIVKGKQKTIFSSRIEKEVVDYINNH